MADVVAIAELIERRDRYGLRDAVADWPRPDLADLLTRLTKTDRVLLVRALPREVAADAFVHLGGEQQDALLLALTDEETRELVASHRQTTAPSSWRNCPVV